MGSKETIKKLYEEYKKQFLDELYDTPLKYSKDSNIKYVVYSKEGNELAYFLFRIMYNVDDSPINYRKYKVDRYWDVSWFWKEGLDSSEKTPANFIRLTSTSFKVVNDFIESNNYPLLLGFAGLTEAHDRIYSNIDRLKILFGEKYYVEFKNDKIWIINKILKDIDEHKIISLSELKNLPPSEISRRIKYPLKKENKGITRHNIVKEQIKRIILKQIYLKD